MKTTLASSRISLFGPGRYGLGTKTWWFDRFWKAQAGVGNRIGAGTPKFQSLCFRSKGVLGSPSTSLDFSFLSCNTEAGEHPSSMDSKHPFKRRGPCWSFLILDAHPFPKLPWGYGCSLWLSCRLSSYCECECVCVCVSRKTANPGPSLGASYVLGMLVRAHAPEATGAFAHVRSWVASAGTCFWKEIFS